MDAVREEVAELRGEPAPAEFYVAPHRYVDKPTDGPATTRPPDTA